MFRANRVLVFFFDVVLIAASLAFSFLLRFDFYLPAGQWGVFIQGLVVVLLAKPVLFAASGMYRNIWRYASLQDAFVILKVVTLSSMVSAFVHIFIKGSLALPRSIYILDWFILFALVAASRLVWRIYRETKVIP